MALGSLALHPDSGLTIVPCGMNYFHAHRFRSRCVVEFGAPVSVRPELVELYRNGERREAIGGLLTDIHQALLSVTVNAPDYETLMVSLPCGLAPTNRHSSFKPFGDSTTTTIKSFHWAL
jgi:glycerol-3-phosphate O-acyltransferase / dihydroxyacetone phosphate acyltransferase